MWSGFFKCSTLFFEIQGWRCFWSRLSQAQPVGSICFLTTVENSPPIFSSIVHNQTLLWKYAFMNREMPACFSVLHVQNWELISRESVFQEQNASASGIRVQTQWRQLTHSPTDTLVSTNMMFTCTTVSSGWLCLVKDISCTGCTQEGD